MFLLIIILVTAAVLIISLSLAPNLQGFARSWQKKEEEAVAQKFDLLFSEKNPREIMRLYFILPPVLGVALLILVKSLMAFIGGALLGLFIPNLILKVKEMQRKQKFSQQLVNAIMILSSSLKGGLSLLQALEVLSEEMPPPMSQEIGWVVRENKMGVPLEDALKRLNQRMDIEELSLVINSILVSRGTGGDLTKVLSRLTTTIRDNVKLKNSIKTLTMQGRLQGTIMSILPFLFIWWVISFNPRHFDIMLKTQQGRVLLLIAAVLQAVGMILIRRFSMIRI